MRHRLDDAHVGAQHVLEEVLAIAGEGQPADVLEAGLAHLTEEGLRVLDGIALGQGIAAEEQLLIGGEDHGLGRGAPEVAADEHRSRRLALGGGSRRRAPRVPLGAEGLQIVAAGDQRASARLGLLLVLALVDPPAELVASLVHGHALGLVLPDLHAPEAGVVERLGGHDDERGRIAALGEGDLALGPELHQVMPPRLLQPHEEEVGAAEEQDLGHGRVALGQGGEVLVDDGLEEARDDLLDGHAGLDERVRVGLREDAALGADLVEREPFVGHLGQPLRGDLELARCLLHECTGAPAAGRLHEDLLGLARAGGGEEDRLHVLAADLRHEAHVGVQTVHGGGDGDHLLDELAAAEGRDEARARAREEDAVAARHHARLGLHALEELVHLLGLARVVALVVLPRRLTVLHDDGLHRGGADVHADYFHGAGYPRPSFLATCRTMLAAMPTASPCGTR